MPENFQEILYIFIGGILGFVFAVLVQWYCSYRVARANLAARLIVMKSFEFDIVRGGEIPLELSDLYKRGFSEVYSLFIIYRELLVFCLKGEATKQWEDYAGGKEFLKFGYYNPPSNKQAHERIKAFLDYLKIEG